MKYIRFLTILIAVSFSTLAFSVLVAQPCSASSVALTVEGKNGTQVYSLTDLQSMPYLQNITSFQNGIGNWKGYGLYRGVPISYLVDQVGGMRPGDTVSIIASDNYSQTFSFNNLYNNWTDQTLQGNMIVAYSFNGTVVPDWTSGMETAFLPTDHAFSNNDCAATSTLDMKESSAAGRFVKDVTRIVVNYAYWNLTISSWNVSLGKASPSIVYGDIQIKNISAYTASGGYIKLNGARVGPDNFTGVNISSLLNAVGGISPNSSLLVGARDGYNLTFTNQQVLNVNVTMMLAYEMNGAAIDSSIGPRLVFVGLGLPMTAGHLWTKIVSSLEIVPYLNVTLNRTQVKPDKPVTIRATLTEGIPIQSQNVTFWVGDQKIGEATTDSQGNASLEYTPTTSGSYLVTVEYVFGVSSVVASANFTASTTVNDGGSNGGGLTGATVAVFVTLFVIVFILAIGVVLVQRNRRKK